MKFMKLGMLSWNDTRHDVVCFMSILREGALEFKHQVSQCLPPSDHGRVFDIHYHGQKI